MSKRSIAKLEAQVSKLREKDIKEVKDKNKKLKKKMSKKIVKKMLSLLSEMYEKKIIIEEIEVQKCDGKINIFFEVRKNDFTIRYDIVTIKKLKKMSSKAKKILDDILNILKKVEKIEEYEIRKDIFFNIRDIFNDFKNYSSSCEYRDERKFTSSERKKARSILYIKCL